MFFFQFIFVLLARYVCMHNFSGKSKQTQAVYTRKLLITCPVIKSFKFQVAFKIIKMNFWCIKKVQVPFLFKFNITLFCSKKLWKVKFKSYVEISGNLVIFKFKSSWYFACVSAVLPVSPLPIQFNLVETFKL